MSDPLNPQTNDDTFLMEGTVTSIAIEAIGTPSVIFWRKDSDDVSHQTFAGVKAALTSLLSHEGHAARQPCLTESGPTG